MASYPGGSTFEGPFEAGRRSGAGGMYLCGVTGIHYRGQWTAGTVLFSGSRLEVEPDIIPHVAEETAQGSGKTGKGGKVLKGKPKASKQQLTAESIDEAGAGKLVVAKYDTSGAVVGLRCRCVLEPQVSDITQQCIFPGAIVLLQPAKGTHGTFIILYEQRNFCKPHLIPYRIHLLVYGRGIARSDDDDLSSCTWCGQARAMHSTRESSRE